MYMQLMVIGPVCSDQLKIPDQLILSTQMISMCTQ
uniref:Uncharacterized protein n=1 Tax=Anguilla anguilla TaxID=7936 RepID=A0A0E9QTF9_ANGAN